MSAIATIFFIGAAFTAEAQHGYYRPVYSPAPQIYHPAPQAPVCEPAPVVGYNDGARFYRGPERKEKFFDRRDHDRDDRRDGDKDRDFHDRRW